MISFAMIMIERRGSRWTPLGRMIDASCQAPLESKGASAQGNVYGERALGRSLLDLKGGGFGRRQATFGGDGVRLIE